MITAVLLSSFLLVHQRAQALPDFSFDVSFFMPEDPTGNIVRFIGGCIRGKCSATEIDIAGGCGSEGGALVSALTFEKYGAQRVKAAPGPGHSILIETSIFIAGLMDTAHRYRCEYERDKDGITTLATAASRIDTDRPPKGEIRRTEWVPFPKSVQIVPCSLRISRVLKKQCRAG